MPEIHVELSSNEVEILHNVLENELSDLRMEIADTDRQEYREQLKTRKAAIRKLLDAVSTA